MRKRSPLLNQAIEFVHLAIRYRTLFPSRVALPITGNSIFVNRHEARGKALLLGGCKGQPITKRFWRESIDLFKPMLAVDCGSNYGEILFLPNYPKETKVVGVEADAQLVNFLGKSLSIHPSRSQIQIEHCLLSDRSDEERTFYVNKTWSGASSAILDDSLRSVEYSQERIKTKTFDDVVGKAIDYQWNRLKESNLIFKIDVEGFEPFVLRGMQKTIATCPRMIGVLEFNPELIDRAGISKAEYLRMLFQSFSVYVWKDSNTVIQVDSEQLMDSNGLMGNKAPTRDILVTNSPSMISRMTFVVA